MHYEKDVNAKVAAWRLFDEYILYCEEKGIRKPSSKNKFNDLLKVNFDVEKANSQDETDKEWHCWVWVNGIKPRVDLSNLSDLSAFPLRSPIEKSCEISDKTDKTEKNSQKHTEIILSKDTILGASKTDKSPLTELTKNLLDYQKSWGKGQINSSNDTSFSLQFVETQKPQWQHNGESGYYSPSAIKGLVDKIFRVTP
jgi:hypothetical protein